jgi:phage terminase small subunit
VATKSGVNLTKPDIAGATQAAIRAGYSEKTASEQSSRLLGNVKVAAAIERAQARRSDRTQITADKVLQRWWDLANVDVNELVEYRRPGLSALRGPGMVTAQRLVTT